MTQASTAIPADVRERIIAAATDLFEQSGRETMPTVDATTEQALLATRGDGAVLAGPGGTAATGGAGVGGAGGVNAATTAAGAPFAPVATGHGAGGSTGAGAAGKRVSPRRPPL